MKREAYFPVKLATAAFGLTLETAQASKATKDLMFGKEVLTGIKRPVMGPVALLGDNAAMVKLVVKDGASQLSRHFERATIFVKWAVLKLLVKLYLVQSEYMIADLFTKAVDKETFLRLRGDMLNMEPHGGSWAAEGRIGRALRSLSSAMGGTGLARA